MRSRICTILMIASLTIPFWGCSPTLKPAIETPAPVKVEYPVPSDRLVQFILTGPREVKEDFAAYQLRVKAAAGR